ncbi:MAG: AsmA-like C-terminal domain-containing protein, partial [Desulfocapsaceae bacterium]
YIKTRAVANDDILTLLDYYKIHLPFKQIEGKTATDLQLAINLNKVEVEAQGVFEIDAGAIEWDGKTFQTEEARIELVNSDVEIKHAKISFADILTAQVAGNIQARNGTGELDVTLDKLILKPEDPRVRLDPSVPAKVRYRFGPDGHFLEAQPSSWLMDSTRLNLQTLYGPVFLDDLAMEVSPVQLAISTGIFAELAGYLSLRKKQVDLTCDLLEYYVKDLQLISSHIPIDIEYDNGLVIRTEETSLWKMSQMPVTLYPSEFAYHDDVFTVISSRISYGSLFDSYLSGFYNTENKKGAFSLKEIDVTSENLGKKLEIGRNADVEVSGVGGKFVVFFPHFDLRVTTDEQKNWSADFGDLSAIYSRSKVLQKYKIKEGRLSVSSEYGVRPYRFSADVKTPYPLLVEGGEPIDQVQVTGRLADEGLFATVNGDLNIVYRDSNLTLKSRQTGYNLNAVMDLLHDFQPANASADTEQEDKQPLLIEMSAEDSQVYLSPQSRLLADTIDLKFFEGKVSGKLKHGPGHIQLQLEKDTFLLESSDLNDEFMGALIKNSRFQGGRMSMVSKGSFDDFSIVFKMQDTNISGLAMVNNVMAFLNTVPALMTFSLPEYNTKGLPIDSAIAGLTFKEKVGTFESLEVKGPELQMIGTGEMDFSKRLIDMDVSIKTQASKNVGKIPLIGYMLAGDDEDDSLSLKISGGFDDPEVSNSLVQDIVVYPVEVLFRTLKLPFQLTEQISDQLNNEPAESDTDPKKEQTEEISIQDG